MSFRPMFFGMGMSLFRARYKILIFGSFLVIYCIFLMISSFYGQYYFEDRYDLVKFIKLVQQAGLYVNLRIGPYVCAEWNFG